MKNQSIFNKTQQSANKFATMLVISAAAMLVGCSSDSSGVSNLEFHRSVADELNDPNAVILTHMTFNTAINAPVQNTAESTTQSSDIMTDPMDNPVVNVVTLAVNAGQLMVSVTKDSGVTWREVSNFGDSNTGGSFRGGILNNNVRFVQFITPVFDAVTTVSLGRVHLDVFASAIESTPATDYLVGGVWLSIPTNRMDGLEIGAFADNIGAGFGGVTALRDANGIANTGTEDRAGTATYSGNANGFRLDDNVPSYFQADVNLTVNFSGAGNFGTNIQVNGMITGGDLPNLTLNMSDNADGTTTDIYTFDGGSVTAEGGYTGTWGGQFYGADGQAIAGVFGANRTDAAGNSDSFGGWFGAEAD